MAKREGAKLQAWYTMSQLKDLTGRTRWEVRGLLRASGVEFSKSGRKDIVYLVALKRALPDLWDSILERLAAANDVRGDE
mgnify:CR=1 FL=1